MVTILIGIIELTLNKGEISNPEPGKRTDWELLHDAVEARRSQLEISNEFFGLYVRYHRGIDLCLGMRGAIRDFRTEVYVLWGATGTGKTTIGYKYLESLYGASGVFTQNGTKWWDGYQGQPGVLVDEFDGSWSYRHWKLICDRLPLTVEKKGSSMPFLARTIVFTSNIEPMLWWDKVGLLRLDEIHRRCDGIIEVKALAEINGRWIQERVVWNGHDLPWPKEGEGHIWT